MTEVIEAAQFDLNEVCIKHARKWNVPFKVHSEDFIMEFLRSHPQLGNPPEKAVEYYFETGNKSAQLFKQIVERDLGLAGRPYSVLEFASGYGCVTRHLACISHLNLTSCDIHPKANDFCALELGVTPMESSVLPENFNPNTQRFDIVFALSFFSHMPKVTWTRWLRVLFEAVSPGGFLLFTTHGLTSFRKCFNSGVSLDEEGFYFHADSEQKDLEKTQYGTTISDYSFVIKQFSTLPKYCEFKFFHAGLWWEHQDLYVLKRLE